MSAISIKVDVFAGTSIREACQDACVLARRINVMVCFDFNGVYCMARPDGHPRVLEDNWQSELASKKTHKIVTSDPREPAQNNDVKLSGEPHGG